MLTRKVLGGTKVDGSPTFGLEPFPNTLERQFRYFI